MSVYLRVSTTMKRIAMCTRKPHLSIGVWAAAQSMDVLWSSKGPWFAGFSYVRQIYETRGIYWMVVVCMFPKFTKNSLASIAMSHGLRDLASGKLTWLWKIPIWRGKSSIPRPFSIAILTSPESHFAPFRRGTTHRSLDFYVLIKGSRG